MAAIGMAESGGNPNAISPTHDYGVWQINKHYWGGLFAEHPWYSPSASAWMACYIWKRQGYNAWATYNHGTYRAYLPGAKRAAANALTHNLGQILTNYANAPGPGGDDWSKYVGHVGNDFKAAVGHLNDWRHYIESHMTCWHTPTHKAPKIT